MSDNVVFLAFKREGSTTEETSHLACRDCRNKTWVITWHSPDQRARLTCSVCGVYAGHIGWHEEETEWSPEGGK